MLSNEEMEQNRNTYTTLLTNKIYQDELFNKCISDIDIDIYPDLSGIGMPFIKIKILFTLEDEYGLIYTHEAFVFHDIIVTRTNVAIFDNIPSDIQTMSDNIEQHVDKINNYIKM